MEYKVNNDHINSLEHSKRMFELAAEEISKLCSSEKDDIVYGFELGALHSLLRDCYVDMIETISSIKENELPEK